MSARPLLVSLHLPKTAGTSFAQALRDGHGEGVDVDAEEAAADDLARRTHGRAPRHAHRDQHHLARAQAHVAATEGVVLLVFEHPLERQHRALAAAVDPAQARLHQHVVRGQGGARERDVQRAHLAGGERVAGLHRGRTAGALVEPLACVVWGLNRVNVRPGSTVLIQGAGPMGCLMLQAVRRAGAAFVAVTDTVPWRLELAASLGADLAAEARELSKGRFRSVAPDGFDMVVDVTGIPAVVEASFPHVRARGTMWLFGVCPPGTTVNISPYDVFRKDLTIIGSFALSKTFPQSLALIRGGAIEVEPQAPVEPDDVEQHSVEPRTQQVAALGEQAEIGIQEVAR